MPMTLQETSLERFLMREYSMVTELGLVRVPSKPLGLNMTLREAAAAEEATERERASMAQAVAPALSAWAEGKDLVHLLATLDECPLAVVAELALLEKVGGARRVGGNVAAERDVTKAYHAAVRALHADRRASTGGLAPERSVEADELLKLLTAAHGQAEWRRYWS